MKSPLQSLFGAVFARNCFFALTVVALSMTATRSASAQGDAAKTGGKVHSASVMDAVHKFYQGYNEHNASLWEQALTPSYVGHVNGQTVPSREAGKGFVATLLSAFPDIHYSIEDSLQAGDRIAVRWSATATHTGNLFGIAPTQKKVNMIGITIFRVENGQVAELWDVWDEAGLMKQLGASK
ncbi:MAG TPA: ester cyclase [Candidatus Acidoferrales bacterium]|nr:ester cyclase [Candidatus Acidoferrales bacterium]